GADTILLPAYRTPLLSCFSSQGFTFRRPLYPPRGMLALKERPLPSAQRRCRLVRTLRKLEESGIRIGSAPNRLVRQDPLVHPHIVARADRGDHCVGAAGRLGIRIGIKRRLQNGRESSAGPPPDADALVRVCLARHEVGQVGNTTGVAGGRIAREPRVGEIEAPPPEVDGARL